MKKQNIAFSDQESNELINAVRDSLNGVWVHQESFFGRHFPTTPTPLFQELRRTLYIENPRQRGWIGVPRHPQNYVSLIKPFITLFNKILKSAGISSMRRQFLDTHNVDVAGEFEFPIHPTILLNGTGPEFTAMVVPRPYASFVGTLSAIEVCLDSADPTLARDRLATIAHEIFQNMSNRRFIYGLVVTESRVTAYMFDHVGVLSSSTISHIDNPDQFVAIIVGLAAEGPMHFEDISRSKSEQRYVVEGKISHFGLIRGRGTVAWKLPGWESEDQLFRLAEKMGVNAGVVKLHHSEIISRSDSPDDIDTVSRNRRVNDQDKPAWLDRTHIRVVLKPFGHPLRRYKDARELIVALHDAIAGHRSLHEDAGILHRDISPPNILLNPTGDMGNRGILIDLDHAIRVDNNSPYAQVRCVIYVAECHKRRNTYLDDLESFYYVLIYVIVFYEKPGIPQKTRPEILQEWEGPRAFESKEQHFSLPFNIKVPDYMGKAMECLASNMHAFFVSNSSRQGEIASPTARRAHYSSILKHFESAISMIDALTAESAIFSSSQIEQEPVEPPKPPKTVAKTGKVRRRPRPRTPVVPRDRPRRKTANYL
ncbi:hypothetical protein M422DRAFT_778612 [Sphaerobolus stellatus SS14]|uniref:Fungal-type protein kinase domain-containing protein n=1 Tax=Sphaerobolus stellatus (strain SS14) TaxID=990650 RepID=A0A0C9W323_SPHS4|nr:hypothetical protein M422DRAFT_778612 [Sphaerobolus stellatus SS14]